MYAGQRLEVTRNNIFFQQMDIEDRSSLHTPIHPTIHQLNHSLTHPSIHSTIYLPTPPPFQTQIYLSIYSLEYRPDLLRQKAARAPKTSQMSLRNGAIETGTIGRRPVKTSAPVNKTSPSDSPYTSNKKNHISNLIIKLNKFIFKNTILKNSCLVYYMRQT